MATIKPTIRQLHIFQEVARRGSFTRASESLHLSQPAVSIQVRQLEKAIGLPLFEQLGKKIYLTEPGEALFAAAQNIGRALEDISEVVDEFKGHKRGRLSVSVASTAGSFATRILAGFARLYPEVSISLDVTNRERLLEQLDANECDLAIMGRPPADRELEYRPFMDNPLVIVSAPDHPFAERKAIPVTELQRKTFVVREPGSGTRAAARRFFDEHGVVVQFAMEMTSNDSIKQAVQAGLGLAVASRHTLELELETGRLVMLDVEGFPIMRHWYLVQRKGKRLSPIARMFESFVLETGADYK
jgi:DNA-binding transcriptional LysR family regulator